MKFILTSVILFVLTSCSIAYETLQNIDKSRCEEMINPSDRQSCLNQNRDSYDEYQHYLKNKKSGY